MRSPRLRIAVVSTPYISVPPRDYGGTELVVHELVEGLVARGHDVTLFATGDSTTRARLESYFPTPEWPPDPWTDLLHVSAALQQIGQSDFDLIHVHSANALALGRLLPLPIVYTLHHDQVDDLSRYYGHFPAVNFVAISADQRRREVGLPHCTVIHHGLDPARFQWTDSPLNYVCSIGRLSRVKGTHVAIDAAARAGRPIRVAGEVHPPDRLFAETHIVPRLTQPHVTYLGNVGPKAKSTLLRNARALLAPIEWNEPFGLAFIEAMLSGCPVVGFRRGSLPELIDEGITGFLVDSLEEMADAIRPGGPVDQVDRQRCRQRGVRRFSAARMVAEYERLYLRILVTTEALGFQPAVDEAVPGF